MEPGYKHQPTHLSQMDLIQNTEPDKIYQKRIQIRDWD